MIFTRGEEGSTGSSTWTFRVMKPVKGIMLRGIAPIIMSAGGTSKNNTIVAGGAKLASLTGGTAETSTWVGTNISHLPTDMGDRMEVLEGTAPTANDQVVSATPVNNFPYVKINLVNTISGKSEQLISEMPLHYLSEITSKYIGYDKRFAVSTTNAQPLGVAAGVATVNADAYLIGEETATIILGAFTPDSGLNLPYSCLELSNDKYIEVTFSNLAPEPSSANSNNGIHYTAYGIEDCYISSACMKYRTYFVVAGERQRRFSTGAGSHLYMPIGDNSILEEIQLYPAQASLASPILQLEELRQYERLKNDISTVSSDSNNEDRLLIDDANFNYAGNVYNDSTSKAVDIITGQNLLLSGINLGFQQFASIPLSYLESYDVRKRIDSVGKTIEFVIAEPYDTEGVN